MSNSTSQILLVGFLMRQQQHDFATSLGGADCDVEMKFLIKLGEQVFRLLEYCMLDRGLFCAFAAIYRCCGQCSLSFWCPELKKR
jgi:hypothetical protein